MSDAENALLTDSNNNPIKSLENTINGAHGLYLLGQIRQKQNKKEPARECYLKAFEKNPTLFVALQKYLDLQQSYDAKDVDRVTEHLRNKKFESQ